MKKTFVLLMAGMIMIGVTGCGHAGEKRNAGNQAQTEGNTEENEAEESGMQDNGQSEPLQENEDAQASEGAKSAAMENTGEPTVYMTADISSDGLMAVYEALGASPEGSIAVKLSTGEPGSNYLRTDLIGELVQSLDANIVECNTAYGGSRASTAMHYQVAEDHGYTEHDIGILASFDPVALDQACVDLVYGAEDGQSLVERMESRNGLHTLEYAQDIGLGSRDYNLVSID